MYWFDFGKLRELRKDNHLTQKAAGKLVGCTGHGNVARFLLQ